MTDETLSKPDSADARSQVEVPGSDADRELVAVDDTQVTIDVRDDRSPIPFVDLAATHAPIMDDMKSAISGVLERGDFILGRAVEDFEQAFAKYTGTKYAIGVDSGFSALELLLRAHDIGRGDEVITVANTFYATVMAIRSTGATPVLVDMDPTTRSIDPVAIEGAISGRTRAILPVHLYGRLAPMDEINRIARRHGLVVIEDAAQAHGAGPLGQRAGALANGGAFSFYPSKNLGAIGDGGMITVDDPEVARRVRLLHNLGSDQKYRHETAGYNRRLDTLQAAILSLKLPRLDAENAMRRSTARLYGELLADLPVKVPVFDPSHVFHLYVIETRDRDALGDHLNRRSIATGIHYPQPIHLQPAFADLAWRDGDFPRSEHAAKRILSLPMYPRMKQRDTERVAAAIRRFFD